MPTDPREVLVRKMIAEGTSDDDIRATLKVYDAQQAKSPAPSGVSRILGLAKDTGIGALKGAAHTGIDLAHTAAQSGMIPGLSSGSLPSDVTDKARENTAYTNNAQRVGGALETVAELAVPAGLGLAGNAVPRAARAGRAIEGVTNAARNVVVDVNAPGTAALRLQQLGERGGTESRTVTKFLRRVTDPNKPPMNFEEGRDWYSNISRLSADEFNRLPAVMQREMGNLRAKLNDSLTGAADTVGKGQQYANAMKEYAQAAKLNSYRDELVKALVKGALPVATATGAAYWLGSKIRPDLFGSE